MAHFNPHGFGGDPVTAVTINPAMTVRYALWIGMKKKASR